MNGLKTRDRNRRTGEGQLTVRESKTLPGRREICRGSFPLMPAPPRGDKLSPLNRANGLGHRGMAFVAVLFVLIISTSIAMDILYDGKVYLTLAIGSRNSLQAEYLARSALQFTHLLLAFDHQFKRMKRRMKKFLRMAPPEVQIMLSRLQLWRLIPIDCGLLKRVFGGEFGRLPPDKREQPKKVGSEKLYPFGDFEGNCKATLEDESSKINLNRFANLQDAVVLRRQLMSLFIQKKYDPLFENPRATGVRVTRKEQIAAIEDWVDANTQVAGESATSEDAKYRYQERGYRTKNSYFDSLDELHLVYGVDDLFYQTFAPFFTVYGRMSVNINDAAPEVISAIIMTYANVPPPQRMVFYTPQYYKMVNMLITYRSYFGFESVKQFINLVRNPDNLILPVAAINPNPNLPRPGELPRFPRFNPPRFRIHVGAKTFRVEAVGIVGFVERRITAVIHVNDSGKRDVLYWRLQ